MPNAKTDNHGTFVFDGLLPEQYELLNKPIYLGDVSVLNTKGTEWPYIDGALVTLKLNRIFGFDGWSTEDMRVEVIDKSLGKDKSGNPQYNATVMVTLNLTLICAGGRRFTHCGVGVDTKKSSNFSDVVANAAPSAKTRAIRNAAMELGQQFGLAVMRVKDNRNWRERCSDKRHKHPDMVMLSAAASGSNQLSDGRTFDMKTGVVHDSAAAEQIDQLAQALADTGDEHDGDEHDGPSTNDLPVESASEIHNGNRRTDENHDDPKKKRVAELLKRLAACPLNIDDQRMEGERIIKQMIGVRLEYRQFIQSPEPTDKIIEVLEAIDAEFIKIYRALEAARSDKKPDEAKGKTDAQERSSGASNEREGRPAQGNGQGDTREKVLKELRDFWGPVGKERGKELFAKVCAEHKRQDLTPMMLPKPASENGPRDELLRALRSAFRAAQPGGGA